MAPFERWVRDRVQRTAARVLLPGPPAAAARLATRPLRVLVMRYDMLGDLVLTTGAIEQIASSRPGTQVDVLARSAIAPALDHLPGVRRVIPFDVTASHRYPSLALLADVRRQRYDVVVDGMSFRHASPTSSIMIMVASGARYRIGLRGARNSYVYNQPVDADLARHKAEQFAALALPFGADLATADCRPRLAISNTERAAAAGEWGSLGRGLRMFVNVTTADRRRDWPDDRMIACLRRVRGEHEGVRVVVTGVPDQQERLAQIADAAGVSWCTQTLRGTMALVATADLVLTPDTAIVHIAAAFGRPTVSLHRRNMGLWTPYGVPSRVLFSDDDATLASIDTASVMAAVTSLLDEQFGGVPSVTIGSRPARP